MPVALDLGERVEALHDRREGRDADVLEHLVARRAGRALDAVEADVVEAVLVRDLDVVANAAGAELDRDRLLPAGRLAELLDLDHEVVGAEHVGVARRRAQVDAGRDAAQARDVLGHLLRHQLAAEAGLRALGDVDLDAVGLAHDVDVPAEPAAEALDDDALRRLRAPPG